MEVVRPGKYVELAYDLYEIDNGKEELMLSMTRERPECIVFGVEQNVIPALCNAIENKAIGDKFDITIAPEDAFGEYNDELVMDLERSIFEGEDGKIDPKRIYEGAAVTMRTEDGAYVNGLIVNISDTTITVNFNHPLAGKTVRFVGEITLVRNATEKELHPVSCGCCGGHCGDGCDDGHHHDHCGCGDGCCH